MSDYKDKIIASQTMTNDIVAELSTMLSQDNLDKDNLRSLYERARQLSDTLSEVPTRRDVKL